MHTEQFDYWKSLFLENINVIMGALSSLLIYASKI